MSESHPPPAKLLEVIRLQADIAKQGLDLGGVMALVVDRTLALLDADGAVIELAEGEDMVYRAASGLAAPFLGLRLDRRHSLSGRCVASGTALRCDDAETDPRVDREACRRIGLRAMIVLPLKHRGHVVGVLKALSREPGRFDAAAQHLLELLSELVAAAMYYATKYDTDALFHQATHDGLTGLANRALFLDRLRNLLLLGSREQRAAAVLAVDMNGLKAINDGLGHRAGDAAIAAFAARLKEGARQSDTVARLGGDEFGLILTPYDGAQPLAQTLERLRAQIERPFRFEDRDIPLSASLGAALYPDEGQELDALLELADQRMYQAKQAHYRARASA